jgi:hypothetical protein
MFWRNKETLISEFCLNNPYKFKDEELEITRGFSKGFREAFVIVCYDDEYTGFMYKDKIYMLKGLNSNIDEIISYKDLPYVAMTAIIPFKNYLVYDGILQGMNMSLGMNVTALIENEASNLMKYYHL